MGLEFITIEHEADHRATDSPICPYCGCVNFYDTDTLTSQPATMDCDNNKCGKVFFYEVEAVPEFSTKKVPCINDGHPHRWIERDHSRTCRDCGQYQWKGDTEGA